MEFSKGPCGRRIFQVDLDTTSKCCSMNTKEVWTQKHCERESERTRELEGWEKDLRGKGSSGGSIIGLLQRRGGWLSLLYKHGSTYNPSWELEVGRATLGVRCFPQSLSMLFWGRVSSWTWSCVWGSQASQLALGTPYLCLLHTGIACRHSVPTQIFLCGFWGFRLSDSSIQVGVLPSEPQFPNN